MDISPLDYDLLFPGHREKGIPVVGLTGTQASHSGEKFGSGVIPLNKKRSMLSSEVATHEG